MDFKQRTRDGIVVLNPQGKLIKGEGIRQLKEHILDLADSGHDYVVVNLSQVPYVDSSGLGELVQCYGALRDNGGQLGLTNLNRRLVDLMTITKLSEIFATFDSEDAAVATFKGRMGEA